MKPKPNKSWSLQRIATYVKTLASGAEKRWKIAVVSTALDYYDAGHALILAKARIDEDAPGTWCKWQDQNGLNRKTVWIALKIYRGLDGDREAAKRYALAEVKRLFAPETLAAPWRDYDHVSIGNMPALPAPAPAPIQQTPKAEADDGQEYGQQTILNVGQLEEAFEILAENLDTELPISVLRRLRILRDNIDEIINSFTDAAIS
ncbi:MAG TPA: hypothetical protein VG326_14580 [Tepidisphaeraceae bacterium]|jgi:hypothetical protein|nr:hypothetical protein [Tepidisphaeraceae bacterium]